MFLIGRSWGIALHPGRECKVPTRSDRNRPSILLYSKASRLTGATACHRSYRLEISRAIAVSDQCKQGASPGFVSRHTLLKGLVRPPKPIRPEIPGMAAIPPSESGSFWKRVSLLRLTRPSPALHSARLRAPVSRLIH